MHIFAKMFNFCKGIVSKNSQTSFFSAFHMQMKPTRHPVVKEKPFKQEQTNKTLQL